MGNLLFYFEKMLKIILGGIIAFIIILAVVGDFYATGAGKGKDKPPRKIGNFYLPTKKQVIVTLIGFIGAIVVIFLYFFFCLK